MQRPSIAPIIEARLDTNIVESCRYIRDDPENEPQRSPRLTHNHGDILACQSQSNHAPEVDHPVYNKCAMPICNWIAIRNVSDFCVTCDWVCVGKINLKSHGDEGVCKGEEEVRRYCCKPSPENQLVEVQLQKDQLSKCHHVRLRFAHRWMTFRLQILHVYGQVEREREKGYDDQVYSSKQSRWLYNAREARLTDQPDTNSRNSDIWIEWP